MRASEVLQAVGQIKLLAFCLIGFGTAYQRSALAEAVLDDFVYANSALARAAWVATSGPQVNMASAGPWGDEVAMALSCDFATRDSRCYWDRTVAMNLGRYTDFELEIHVPDPGAISSFTLYFRSGSGWYGASASVTGLGWQTLRFARQNFIAEGTPSGWDHIDRIRLSPWKGAARNTTLAVRKLRAFTPRVLLVRDHQSSNPTIVQDTIDRHIDWLGRYNIDCGVISRAEVESGFLSESRIAILPYNENISTAEWTALGSFVNGGGKLMVYYLLPAQMEPLLGFRGTGWTKGDFGAWAFEDADIPQLPQRVIQNSWNITLAMPTGAHNSRVSAVWLNNGGESTGRAAWLRSDKGLFLSHVLLGDDAEVKSYALLCLIGHFMPEVWQDAGAGAIASAGKAGPYLKFPEAESGIRAAARMTIRWAFAEAELALATQEYQRATNAQARADYPEAIKAAQAARQHLREAYALSLRPLSPELRGIWEHHATGPFPGNWPAAIEALATNGFNAVFPNMLWGGLAHYNSSVLPHSAEYETYGDQIAACVDAARAKGIQTHIWKVNWNLLGAPQAFIDSLRATNRTQVSSTGQPMDWLCPSHPDNFAMETNSMLEVVRNYNVDGIHFDYIRYPGGDHCYCSGCGQRFQEQTGRTVPNWPASVLAQGGLRTAFMDWRRAQITKLVAAVHDGVKALKPSVKISAAVFPDAASAYDGVGQDWRKWIEEGLVDFLCPMDYSQSLSHFTNLVAQQLAFAGGRIPIYPGIGAFILEPDGFLAQVEATREAGAGGFIAFELSSQATTNLLPAARAGATAPDEPDTDRDFLPDAWELRFFTDLEQASMSTDFDKDGRGDRAEYVLGGNPKEPDVDPTLKFDDSGSRLRIELSVIPATGAGYGDAERHYRIETTTQLSQYHPEWEPVEGFSDHVALGATNLVIPVTPENAARFYRACIWLQQPQGSAKSNEVNP